MTVYLCTAFEIRIFIFTSDPSTLSRPCTWDTQTVCVRSIRMFRRRFEVRERALAFELALFSNSHAHWLAHTHTRARTLTHTHLRLQISASAKVTQQLGHSHSVCVSETAGDRIKCCLTALTRMACSTSALLFSFLTRVCLMNALEWNARVCVCECVWESTCSCTRSYNWQRCRCA